MYICTQQCSTGTGTGLGYGERQNLKIQDTCMTNVRQKKYKKIAIYNLYIHI